MGLAAFGLALLLIRGAIYGIETDAKALCPAPTGQETGTQKAQPSERKGAATHEQKETAATFTGSGPGYGLFRKTEPADKNSGKDTNRLYSCMEARAEATVLRGVRSGPTNRHNLSPGIPAGIFKITAYNNDEPSTGKRPGVPGYGITATGSRTKDGRTIAADWRVLPPGTVVYIDGVGYRVVEDRGGAISGKTIDLFIDGDEATLYAWGVRYRIVYVVKWGNGSETINRKK